MENLLFQLFPATPRSIWVRYAVTTLVIVLTTLLRYSLDPILVKYPFLLYIPAIFLVSLLFDRASGFIAVIFSCLAAAWLFIEPRGSFRIGDRGDQVAFLIYAILGFGVAAITEALRRTLEELRRALEKVAASDREKDLMLSEVHHRLRNDLQLISAQLSLAAGRSGETRPILEGIIERIGVLARVYGRLRRLDGTSIVDAKEFLESLVEDLQHGMVGVRPVALSARAQNVDLDMATAVAVGTIANELVTNALKYAFPDARAGWVDLSFLREGDEYVLRVSDNGTGLPSGPPENRPKGTGLGSRIMQQLALQLRGRLEVHPRPDGGVMASLRFPVQTFQGT